MQNDSLWIDDAKCICQQNRMNGLLRTFIKWVHLMEAIMVCLPVNQKWREGGLFITYQSNVLDRGSPGFGSFWRLLSLLGPHVEGHEDADTDCPCSFSIVCRIIAPFCKTICLSTRTYSMHKIVKENIQCLVLINLGIHFPLFSHIISVLLECLNWWVATYDGLPFF